MRFRSPLLVLVLGLMAASAEASPFTFEFVLPAWSSSSSVALFGTHATLDVTVDNGSLSPISQTYLFGSVTQLVVDTTPAGGTYRHTFAGPPSFGLPTIQFFFTAPVTAAPTLDASAFGGRVFDWHDATDEFFLDGGAFPGGDLLLQISAPLFQFADARLPAPALLTGRLLPIPEPATLSLVGLGAGLGFYRRRRRG